MVLEVKGRVRRWNIDGMVGIEMMVTRKMRTLVSGFSLMEIRDDRVCSCRDIWLVVI